VANLPTTADELGDLAQKGAIALVGAMATGAFGAARAGIARLFRRMGPDRERATQTQLNEHEVLVNDAEDGERDGVRDDLARVWRRTLKHLLEHDPAAARELRDLVAELRSALPEERQQWIQTVIASGDGTVCVAQGGNVYQYASNPVSDKAGGRPGGSQ
jgi:hypothetical protein